MCDYHDNEGHEAHLDWCQYEQWKTGMRDDVWGVLGSAPMDITLRRGLFAAYPPGSIISAECDKCHGRLAIGFESHSFGKVKGVTELSCVSTNTLSVMVSIMCGVSLWVLHARTI
jgi:hypothetical protein